MAEVICVDGSVLGVHPEPVLDRDGATYEITLRLTRDGAPFGSVGERCGYFLAATHGRLVAAAADGSPEAADWPDPHDRFPVSSLEGGLRAWAADRSLDPVESSSAVAELLRYLPRDRELFAFRHRDPDDLAAAGELSCAVHTLRTWVLSRDRGPDAPATPGGRGHWRLGRRAVLAAWGDRGVGVRAVLTAGELTDLLAALLAEAEQVGARYDASDDGTPLRRPAG